MQIAAKHTLTHIFTYTSVYMKSQWRQIEKRKTFEKNTRKCGCVFVEVVVVRTFRSSNIYVSLLLCKHKGGKGGKGGPTNAPTSIQKCDIRAYICMYSFVPALVNALVPLCVLLFVGKSENFHYNCVVHTFSWHFKRILHSLTDDLYIYIFTNVYVYTLI